MSFNESRNETPPLQTLIFYTTRACNLRCRHCWQQTSYRQQDFSPGLASDEISSEDFSRILDRLIPLGLSNVRFTGGEPFLNDNLMEYIQIADQKGMHLFLETNGTLISNDMARELGNLKHLHVAVSLDGAVADSHEYVRGVPGCFDRAINGIKRLSQHGILFQIIMCLLRVNRNNIADMAALATSFSAGILKVNPVLPMGRGRQLREAGDFLTIRELLDVYEDFRRNLSPRYEEVIHFAMPMAFQPFPKIQTGYCTVCSIFNILGMMPNGDLSFCGVGNLQPELVVGNILTDDVGSLWEEAGLFQEIRQQLPNQLKGVCARCIFHGVCIGECRAMAYHQTHDLMAAYWMCQEAYDAGLFPPSRLLPATGGSKV